MKNNTWKYALISIALALFLCCICIFLTLSSFVLIQSVSNRSELEPTIAYPNAATQTPPIPTSIPTPTITLDPNREPLFPGPLYTGLGLGVSRAEMVEKYKKAGYVFDQPTERNNLELVTGINETLCVESRCALIALWGPSDNLMAISLLVPVVDHRAQSVVIDVIQPFSNWELITEIPGILYNASSLKKDRSTEIFRNNYLFKITYHADSDSAMIIISKPRP